MIHVDFQDCLLFVDVLDAFQHKPQWSFRLQFPGEQGAISACDHEPGLSRERLMLFGLMRGLEALESPSRVCLICSSSYLRNGLESGVEAWRRTDWKWEKFGQLVEVRDADLWRRVDRALVFHQVRVKLWRVDTARPAIPRPHHLRHKMARQLGQTHRIPA
jgi:hypothetical protein